MNPEHNFGDLYSPIVSVAVAIILFEGSLSLNLKELSGLGKPIFRISSIGAFLAWILGSLTAHYMAGLSWAVAFVIGGLDRKSTRLNSSHVASSYAVFFLKKKTMQGRTLPYMKLQKCEITDIFPTSRICATLGGSLSFRLGSELPHGGCAGKRTTDRSMLY